MKKRQCLFCLLLVGAVFSLAAQTNPAVVYLQSVTGTGIDPQDNNFFYIQMYRELSAQDHITIGTYNSSDFSLLSSITPIGMNENNSFEYYFDLYLQDNITDEIVSEQHYKYANLDTAGIALRLMVSNVLAVIESIPHRQPAPQPVTQPAQPAAPPTEPAPQPVQPVAPPVQQATQPVYPVAPAIQPAPQPIQPAPQPVQPAPQPVQPAPQPIQPAPQPIQPAPQPIQPAPQPVQPAPPPVQPAPRHNDWRDRWLFLGFSALWTPRFYYDAQGWPAINPANPGGGLYMELQVLDSVSLETGFEFALDRINVFGMEQEVVDFMLEVPILLKIVIKPGAHFLLEPYGGIQFNHTLWGYTRPPQLAWVAGYQHGVKAGPGAFLFDFRFSMDIGRSSLAKAPDVIYQRYNPSFGIGYKAGFIQKR